MSKNSENIKETVESVAEELVMLDIKDLPAMAKLTKTLSALAELLSEDKSTGDYSSLAQTAEDSSSLIRNIILNETKQPEEDLQTASKLISKIQETVSRGTSKDMITPGPTEESISLTHPHNNGVARQMPVTPLSVIDQDLFIAFLEQQESVLPDIESEIMAFEKDKSQDHIAALKRIIHTMKGEAGVCGITDIEKICHKVEDYINTDSTNISMDFLLEVKDCLAESVNALRNGTTSSCIQKILERMDKKIQKTAQEKPTPSTETAKSEPTTPVSVSDPDLARDFVAESQEHFETADENLLILENDPTNQDAIGAVFRAFHTIKGVSGFIGLTPIGDLAHVAETLLDEVRKGKRSFAGNVVEVTFNALDMLKTMISDLNIGLQSGNMFYPRKELPGLIQKLKNILNGTTDSEQPAQPEPKPAGQIEQTESAQQQTEAPAQQAKSAATEIRQTMKVDAEKIDILLDMIGELVIAESIVASDPEIMALKSLRLEKNIGHLSKITRQLQDTGMGMRLIPIEATFKKMARLVRDLATKCGKKIELSMEGQETEIDKGMVEKLGDPLVHMIRNSVDHGVEDSDERKAAGKDPTGHITLRAHHKGGSVQIEIEDDGKGLDRDAIIAKAIERNLITSGDGMSDQNIFSLIFEAGFSTAKQVTEVSGRGVGMDVVRRNIESLRGHVLISSTKGKGSIFTIVLPLTMAIIDGMAVTVGQETYIIPVLSIIESIRPSADMISTVTGKGTVFMFRNKLIPLFRLGDLFNVQNKITNPTEGIVIVVEDGGKQTAILVDNIIGQQQTVIKSLGTAMGHVQGVSGVSIMPDGRPGLIVDISGIVKVATEKEVFIANKREKQSGS